MADPYDELADRLTGGGPVNSGQQAIQRGTAQAGPRGRRQSNPVLDQLAQIKGQWIHVGKVPAKQSGSGLDAILSGEDEQNPTYRYQFADGTYVDIGGPSDTVIGGTAIKDLAPNKEASTVGQWTRVTDEQGNVWRLNEATGEKEIVFKADPATAGLKREKTQADLDYTRRLTANVGMPTPRQQRYPDEELLAQLNIQKAQRELTDPFTLAQQQHEQVVKTISDQVARGDIDIAKANELMALSRVNLDATLRGTTPYQLDKDKKDAESAEKTQRQTLAGGLIGNQLQTGTSLGTNLLSGIFGSKILSSAGPPTDFDPLAYGFETAQKYSGGPELSEMARAILRGALQQQPQGGF